MNEEIKPKKVYQGISVVNLRLISDKEAKSIIKDYLIKAKKSGKQKLNLLEMICDLGLPSDQIERIMENLKVDGVRDA